MDERIDFDEGTVMDEETDSHKEMDYSHDDNEPCPDIDYNAWQEDD